MKAIVAAACLWALTAAPAIAADFSYSFEAKSNVSGQIGTVTGVIYGLADEGTSLTRSFSVNTPTFSASLYAIYPSEFTVVDDQITSFSARGTGYADPFFDYYVLLNFLDTTFASYEYFPGFGETWYATENSSNLTFKRVDSAVPEPATWAMMVAGFAAIGLSSRRHRARGQESEA